MSEADTGSSASTSATESTAKARILSQKWGPETMAANYAVIPSALLRGQARLGIGPTDLAVLIHLIDYWWQPGQMPWPKKKTLAARLGVGEKTVQRAVVRLEQAGLLRRNSRFNENGGRTSNEYDLQPLVERLQVIAKDIAQAEMEAREVRARATRPGLKSRVRTKVQAS